MSIFKKLFGNSTEQEPEYNNAIDDNQELSFDDPMKTIQPKTMILHWNHRHSTKLSHSSSADVHDVIEHINNRIVYLFYAEWKLM